MISWIKYHTFHVIIKIIFLKWFTTKLRQDPSCPVDSNTRNRRTKVDKIFSISLDIEYWLPLSIPLYPSKFEYSIWKKPLRIFQKDTGKPLFFSKIQYLPLLTIPLLIIMRVFKNTKYFWSIWYLPLSSKYSRTI